MGKQGRSARNPNQPQWQEDDFESLLPSSTRAGTALRPVTKEDVTEVDWVRQLFALRKTKETTAQLSPNTNAAHAVANAAAAEEAAADATTHELHDEDPKTVEVIASINAELKLEQLSIGTAAQTVTNAAAEKAAAGAATFERAAAEQTVVIGAGEQAAAINADAEAAATFNNLHEEIQRLQRLLTAEQAATAAARAAADEAAAATTEPRILRAVLLAAAATANALARSIPPDTVTAHRRGGRPPPTRPRANPRPRPRRTRRPTGMHTGTPTAAGTSTARQSSQHSAFAKSPPRAGQARPQPGARPPRFDST